MKHRIVHALQKYLLNPPIKLFFALGTAPPGYALLETTGRKTGNARRTPVDNGRIGGAVLDHSGAWHERNATSATFRLTRACG